MLRSKLSIYSLENEPLLDRFDLGSETEKHPCNREVNNLSFTCKISQSKLPNYSDILWEILFLFFLSGMREKWCSWSCLQPRTTNVCFTRHVMSSIVLVSCEPWHGRLWSGWSAQIYSGESLRSHCGWSERYSSTQHQGYGSIWAAFPGHVLYLTSITWGILRSSMGFSFLEFRIARFFHRFRSLQRSRSLMLCVVLRAVSSSHFQPSDSCFTVTQSLIRLVLTKQNARKESSEKDEEQKEKPKDKDSIWHSSASHKLLITIYSNTFLWFSLHSLCMASGSSRMPGCWMSLRA